MDGPLSRRPVRAFDSQERRRRRRTGGRLTLLYVDRGIGTRTPSSTRRASDRGPGHPRPTGGGWTNERTSSEARLAYALGELRRIGAALEVPRAELEEAARLYRQVAASGCIQGRDIDAFTAACLLVAVRRSSVQLPISSSEIVPISRTTAERLRTARGVLERELDLGVPPMDPRHFLPAAVTTFDLPVVVENTCRDLLARLADDEEARCRGFSPRTLAGAAIHLACDIEDHDGPTLDEIGAELDVAGSTISERKSFLERFEEGC